MNGLLCTEMFRLGVIAQTFDQAGRAGLASSVRSVAALLADAREESAQVIALECLEDLAERAARAGDNRLLGVHERLTMKEPVPA